MGDRENVLISVIGVYGRGKQTCLAREVLLLLLLESIVALRNHLEEFFVVLEYF